MPYQPIYGDSVKITWENDPSTATPLSAQNLNTESQALHDIDARVCEIGNTAIKTGDIGGVVEEVSFDSKTGVFTFTKYNGETYTIDTLLEKVVTNWGYDAETQSLVLTLEDGTVERIDISDMISEYDFEDSETIAWNVVNHKVVAIVKGNSIGAEQLETNFLANCVNAQNNASASAAKAEQEALEAEGWAVGEQNGVPVDSTSPYYHNNAKYYSDKTGARTLASLDDVALSNVEEGQALVYDAENDKWVNGDAIPKYKLNAPTNVSATAQNESVVLKWTDPDDLILGENTLAKWIGTAIIQKVGSAPTSIEDGTPIYASMVRNQHSEVGYVVEGLENDTEYFFGIFPVSKDRVANTSVVVSATPEGNINHIKEWCQTIGLSYESLEDITEADMRKLMSKHVSVDYFMEWYASDNAMLDMFTVNEIAMKWIGLNYYICDKLLVIEDAESRLLASPYWEYILKDHVPIMTSNTAPYGTASGSNIYESGYDFYKAFDGDDTTMWRGSYNTSYNASASGYLEFTFPNPICVKRIKYIVPVLGNAKPQTTDISFVGYNGTEEIPLAIASVDGDEYKLNNDAYVMKIRTNLTQKNLDTLANARAMPAIATLQFYGRSLNVSVPTMTSNTMPYGEVIYSSGYQTSPYLAFDGNDSTYAASAGYESPDKPDYCGYTFDRPIHVKKVAVLIANGTTGSRTTVFTIDYKREGASDWETTDVSFTVTTPETSPKWYFFDVDIDNDKSIRIRRTDSDTVRSKICTLNFFGVDYSDRTERTYLYDHGLKLIPMSMGVKGGGDGLGTVTENALSVTCACTDATHDQAPFSTNEKIDFSKYSKAWLEYDLGYAQNTTPKVVMYFSNVRAVNTTNLAGVSTSIQTNPLGRLFLDISNFNDTCYMNVGSLVSSDNGGACSVDIKQIWLE